MMPDADKLSSLVKEHFALRAPQGCPESKRIALYAAGELEPEERAAFDSHLAGCASCREDLAEFGMVASIWERAAPAGRRPWLLRLPLAAGLAAAALAAVVLLTVRPPLTATDPLKPKGPWQLHVAIERAGRAHRAAPGELLKEGDHLGFFYSAESPGFLAVVSADLSGEIVRLHPTAQDFSAPVAAGREVRLSAGAALGPARGCEWIVALFSNKPFAEPATREALERMVSTRHGCELGRANLPGVEVQVFEVSR